MTQHDVTVDHAALEKAWARIGRNAWHQMAWFTRLANMKIGDLSRGDLENLQDECLAIRATPFSFRSRSADRKRYPHRAGQFFMSHRPTVELVETQQAVSKFLNDIADDKTVTVGTFAVNHTIEFRKANAVEMKAGYPRYLIYPMEIPANIRGASHEDLLLRMARLLEVDKLVDKVRRCPHCKNVFVQLRKNARYCGPPCYSVAGMQNLRARRATEATQRKVKKGRQKEGRTGAKKRPAAR